MSQQPTKSFRDTTTTTVTTWGTYITFPAYVCISLQEFREAFSRPDATADDLLDWLEDGGANRFSDLYSANASQDLNWFVEVDAEGDN